jgi:hypothetical protein
MDTTAWLLSVLLPALIAAATCWGANRLSSGRPIYPLSRQQIAPGGEATGSTVASAAILSFGWAVAVSASLMAKRWAAGEATAFWWPEEFWQRGFVWLCAAALLLGTTVGSLLERSAGRWVVAGLLAITTAASSVPNGEGWEDTLPLHRQWIALLAGSCLVGLWSLDRFARRNNDRWSPLVVLATLAGPMLVGATTYSGLAEWTMAAIVATVVCAAFAGSGRMVGAIGIVYPATIFVTVLVAAGRFYSYEDPPWWSYLGILSMAPAVSAADWLVASRPTLVRVAVAASVATLMFAASALWHLADL